jgi:LPS sulfotransferase NodH
VTPQRVVVIAATARSGSTLLGAGLATTGVLGDAKEHFNQRILHDRRREWGAPRITMRGHAGRLRRRLSGDRTWTSTSRFTRRSMARYLDRLAEDRTGPTGVLSCKTMWTQYQPVLLSTGLSAGYWGVPVDWVRIGRVDRVRQAVSIVRAKQTGLWTAAHNAANSVHAAPTYDAPHIARNAAAIARDEASWDRYFDGLGVEPFTVTYEQLDADYDGTMASVLSHLGVDTPVPPRQLKRQSDAINDEWVARFLADGGHRG